MLPSLAPLDQQWRLFLGDGHRVAVVQVTIHANVPTGNSAACLAVLAPAVLAKPSLPADGSEARPCMLAFWGQHRKCTVHCASNENSRRGGLESAGAEELSMWHEALRFMRVG